MNDQKQGLRVSIVRSMRLQPKRIDQSRQRGWLLPAARVIKEESGEGLAPVLQHANERPTREMRRHVIICYEGQADAIERSPDHEVHVIEDQRPAHCYGKGFPALFELPAVNAAARSVPKIDTLMIDEIVRRLWPRMRLEISGRADNRGAMVG